MAGRVGVIARRLGLAPPTKVVAIFIHVTNCFCYMMVIIADRELRNMRSPCSEARSRFSRSSRGLQSKVVLAAKSEKDRRCSKLEACGSTAGTVH
jgi:hypothetical protein